MAVTQDSDFFAPRHPSALSIAAYRIADFFDQAAIQLRHHIVRTQTERALSQLSDRLLADIGMTRSDIPAFSARAADRWVD